MKYKLFFCLLVISFFSAFSEEATIIESVNIYGGKTIELRYNEQEQRNNNYSKLTLYFDNNDVITKLIFTVTNNITADTGIKEQIQYYEKGILVRYEMHFTDEHEHIHGYNKVIEDIGSNGAIAQTNWYNNETLLDVDMGTGNRFVFYNIEFIENEFINENRDNENMDVINISVKYYSLRSVINFDTELIDIDDSDRLLMRYFAGSFRINDFTELYSKKVRVYSGNKSYWLFVQTDLIQFVKGQRATVSYYPIARNKDLYLICVGFYDIDN